MSSSESGRGATTWKVIVGIVSLGVSTFVGYGVGGSMGLIIGAVLWLAALGVVWIATRGTDHGVGREAIEKAILSQGDYIRFETTLSSVPGSSVLEWRIRDVRRRGYRYTVILKDMGRSTELKRCSGKWGRPSDTVTLCLDELVETFTKDRCLGTEDVLTDIGTLEAEHWTFKGFGRDSEGMTVDQWVLNDKIMPIPVKTSADLRSRGLGISTEILMDTNIDHLRRLAR